MADESSEKTEQPTHKKIQDAREKGQVAQSKELTSLVAVVVLCATIVIIGDKIFNNVSGVYQAIFNLISKQIKYNELVGHLMQMLKSTIEIVLIPVLLSAIISLFVNFIQIKGVVFNKEFLKFDIKRLNPVDNFKNIYGIKNLIKFVRMMVEVLVITATVIVIILHELNNIVSIYQYDIKNIAIFIGMVISKILASVFLIMLIFAVIDLILEKRNLTKQLMMSLSELKQEYKNTDGDPEVKSRRKELHREILEDDDMGYGLSNASLILANPTHIAIVILYQPKRFKLPIILAKAKGETAQKIFSYARKHDILIIRDKWLARQLYSMADAGRYVPKSLLACVADVIGRNLHLLPKVAFEISLVNKMNAGAANKPVSPTTKIYENRK